MKQYRIKFLQTATFSLLLVTCCIFHTIHVHEGSRSIMYGALLSNQYQVVKLLYKEIQSGRVALLTNNVNNYKLFPHSFYALMQLYAHEDKILPKQTDAKHYEYELGYDRNDSRFGGIELVRTKELIAGKNNR